MFCLRTMQRIALSNPTTVLAESMNNLGIEPGTTHPTHPACIPKAKTLTYEKMFLLPGAKLSFVLPLQLLLR